jgi:hypothetical protein
MQPRWLTPTMLRWSLDDDEGTIGIRTSRDVRGLVGGVVHFQMRGGGAAREASGHRRARSSSMSWFYYAIDQLVGISVCTRGRRGE